MNRPHQTIAEEFADRRERVREAGRRFRERQRVQRVLQRQADALEAAPGSSELQPKGRPWLAGKRAPEPSFARWLDRVIRLSDSLGDLIEVLRRDFAQGEIRGDDWRDIRLHCEREKLDLRLAAGLWDAFCQSAKAGRVSE
ncbi:MAG: hypothetical protein CTY20_00640 [Hyphomicrobium sp.]|nr:MAG: hypothetical protein CTY20_00640 [Hyphomicrobium sp.]